MASPGFLDPRRLLALPGLYSTLQKALGTTQGRRRYVTDFLRPRAGDKVLDIGCGPADILAELPEVDYFGFDMDAGYIAAAQARFGKRGQFAVQRVTVDALDVLGLLGHFDIVMATGLLHHLDDREAANLFEIAWRGLRIGGRLITCDPAFVAGQNPIARAMIKFDRGSHVRAAEAYASLARSRFSEADGQIVTNLTRVPYTHFILECPRRA